MDVVSYALAKKYVDDNIANIAERGQADWNQNDPNASDYVKNRPFYNSVEEESIIVTYDGVNPIVDAELCAKIWANKRSAKYTVNGVEATYDGLSGTITDINWMYTLWAGGTKYYIAARRWSKDSTEIDELLFMQASNAKHVPGTVSFTSEHEVVHQLDEKFIPDTIARVSDILGQSQSDWNQNDPNTKDYVKNRPFYEGYKILGTFLRGDNELQISLTVGKSYIVDCDGVIYTVVCEQLSAAPKGLRIMKEGGGVLFVIYENSQYIYEVDRVVLMDPDELVVYKLDEKFIPDTIARVNDVGEVATDDEIVDILIQEDMLFAFTDLTGSILTDENNNILTW